jgi:hypothetical protein
VARAKRTARADARRRYRADHGLPDETAIEEEAAAPTASPARSSATTQPARIGMAAAFRQAFRPLDVRGDLRALPHIAIHSKALWLPIALTILSFAVFVAIRPADRPEGDTLALLAMFLFSYFLQTPAIGGVFIAGFLAPRASWLLGAIVGLVSAAGYSALGLSGILPITTTVNASDVVVSAFIISPIMGAIFASAAAWYRRFLQLSSPNRGRAQQPVRRGNDGRSRGANQKAGARR